jgi:hypothetical protein
MVLAVTGMLVSGSPAAAWYGYGRGIGWGGYSPTYVSTADPYGGYLNGAAAVITAQGGWLKDVQQAYLMKEDVKAAKLKNKRAAFDEWMYEKANTPTLEEQREHDRIQNVLRSQHNPPPTEIWSGKALNDLLQDLQQSGPSAMQGPPIYLNQDLLKQINVTTGTTTAGLGILKDPKLQWPLALMDDAYGPLRQQVETQSAAALQQAQSGGVKPNTLKDLISCVDKLQAQLKNNVANIEPNQYIKAKRYLNDLDGSIQTLQDGNAAKYASRSYSAQGTTVAELVQYMTAQGLKFAPATPGDEPAYNSVHRALASYEGEIGYFAEKRAKEAR